ncbi:MAG: ATP-binding protein [Clostridiales bacterium]|nr:ATP-binding protein [Lachnospiraceae bacterium]MCD7920938.1 ATP-binding protein [Clostridiales bacterium]MCD8108943.1 ATP-binding protein [Clostridiales bacterium]MCD8132776.1 ATP-binding protein [Clostridiales bacterium]
MYKKRAIEDLIKRTEKGFKGVLVTGPRQVGKSTVLRHLYEDRKYITFDDPVLLAETKSEPGLFFRNNRPPIVLDEVQYISELFPYIKMECDRSDEKGRFLLTGSQQYHLMKNISESLAGRIAILELAGFSMRELMGSSFHQPFIPSETYIEQREKDCRGIENIWKIIHRGGYPALIDENVDWQTFFSSYIQTYIDRDINALGHVKDKLKFTQFLTAMAARTGQMLNYSNVADQIEVSVNTVKEWTSLLEASGIIYILQPFSNSALKRAIRTPKLYFRDTGLVCFLTKYQTPETALNGAMAGELFETFVVSEILKSFSNAGLDYRMYVSYYRGKDKRKTTKDGQKNERESEIDLLIEQDDVIYPVEIKMSANPKLSMTNAFDVLDRIPEKKRGTGVIVCMYDKVLWLKENIAAVPVEYI